MSIYEKVKLWNDNLKILVHNLLKFNLESDIKNFGVSYKEYTDEIKKISIPKYDNIENNIEDNIENNIENNNIITIELLNILDSYESIYHFLKSRIKTFLNITIINQLKHQRSFSYSNNLENIFIQIEKNVMVNDLHYESIKGLINNENFTLETIENFSQILKRKSISLCIYLNNYIAKNIKLTREKEYKILGIKKSKNNDIYKNIQLIHYPINSIFLHGKGDINDLNNLNPNLSYYIKYNIDPLINKNYQDDNIFSALNLNIVHRLKTIEKVELNTSATEFDNNITTGSGIQLGNHCILSPARISTLVKTDEGEYKGFNLLNNRVQHIKYKKGGNNKHQFEEEDKWYPFGGLNNYTKKYLSITEDLILKNIKIYKNRNKLVKKNIKDMESISYNLDNLLSTLIKEFKIQFTEAVYILRRDNIELDYVQFLAIAIGEEYNYKSYIFKSLQKLHNYEAKNFTISSQIMNPHMNIEKFEKELKINQVLTMGTNGLDLWLSIRNEFFKLKIDRYFSLEEEEKHKELLTQFKLLITKIIENKKKLGNFECIPISTKLYGIIYK